MPAPPTTPTAALHVSLHDVGFQFHSATNPLWRGVSASFSQGFTGLVGPNGAGKSTLLQLLTGTMDPAAGFVEGTIDAPSHKVYCAQRTDVAPARIWELLYDGDAAAYQLCGRLEIQLEWHLRWDSLSHGERKRVQIADALLQQPQLLAIDEPTNHIDGTTRALLVSALQQFTGVGLLVSHDRALLDMLCHHCLWLEPPTATLYQGGFTQSSEQRALQALTANRVRDKAKKSQEQLQRELVRRRTQAASADAQRSKRHLDAKDSSGREAINRAKLTGKDGQAGRQLRQLTARAQRAETELMNSNVTKSFQDSIWLPGSLSQRDRLLHLPPAQIPLGPGRTLHTPHLDLLPDGRIAITGANGRGKSSLMNFLLDEINAPDDKVLFMPQELTDQQGQDVLAEVQALPKPRLGQLMNIVARLGSRPEQLLHSNRPSPGELRKLLLGLGMLRTPHIIMMDEPTNHLDLPSIQALEEALADCPCALMVVSHDEQFLANINCQRWIIEVNQSDQSELIVP